MEECRRKPAPVLEIVFVLIVVLIIGAILFPVFSHPTCSSSKCSCQNNLKEIGVALQLYWDDYDQTLPSSAIVSHSKKWNTPDFVTFATKQGTIPLPAGRNPRTWTELLYDHMKNKDIWWCPKDSKNDDHNLEVSYWYKLAVDKAWFGEGCTIPCRNEKNFAYNADQIVFYEHKGFHFDDRSGLKNGVQINVVYMDTHVKTVQLQSATSGDPVNCAANSNGEPMFFNFDNKRPKNSTDNPDPNAAARYIDPQRYSDSL